MTKTTWGVAFCSMIGASGVALAQEGGELGGDLGGEIDGSEDEDMMEEERTESEVMPISAPPPDEAPPAEPPAGSLSPSLSGFIDGTYNYNLMDPAGGTNLGYGYLGLANTFMLNTAHLVISGNDDKVAYAVEIDAGTDAAANSALSTGFPYLVDVQEAWVSYVSTGGLGFKLGKFVTFQGIEVVENTANPTITRGYLFNLAEPVNHTGAVVTYKIDDTMEVAAGLINGWDVMIDNNSLRSFLGKFSYTADTMAATVSTIIGPEQAGNNDDMRMSFDATGVLKLSSMDLWMQANFGRETFGDGAASTTWFGLGVQPVYPVDDKLSIGARAELFVDGEGATRTGLGLPDGVTLITVGGAPAYKLTDNLILRGEARLDFATEDVFPSKRFSGDPPAPNSMQVVLATEVLYTFGM